MIGLVANGTVARVGMFLASAFMALSFSCRNTRQAKMAGIEMPMSVRADVKGDGSLSAIIASGTLMLTATLDADNSSV